MRRALIVLLWSALLIVAAPASPLPPPDGAEDDAGSGTDAGDDKELALRVDSGAYTGRVGWDVRLPAVWWEYDHRDLYEIVAPPNSSVNVQIEIPIEDYRADQLLWLTFEGPGGLRESFIGGEDRAHPPRRVANLSVSAVPGGSTFLMVEDLVTEGPVSYRFEVTVRRWDHGVALDGNGSDAAAWEVDFPGGIDGRIESALHRPHPPHEARGTWQEFAVRFETHPAGGCLEGWLLAAAGQGYPFLGRNGLDGEDVLWTTGLPHDGAIEPPLAGPPLPETHPPLYPLAREVRGETVNVRLGHANVDGVGVVGSVLWDGPVAPAIDRVRAEAEFLTLEDFEAAGDGFGAQAGPAAVARNLTAEVTVPEDLPSGVVFANALRQDRYGVRVNTPLGPVEQTVPFGVSTPTMTVDVPNGTTRHLEDDFFYWVPLDMPPVNEPRTDENVPGGTWRFHLDKVDGLEGDTVRAMRLGFGFPFDCVR